MCTSYVILGFSWYKLQGPHLFQSNVVVLPNNDSEVVLQYSYKNSDTAPCSYGMLYQPLMAVGMRHL